MYNYFFLKSKRLTLKQIELGEMKKLSKVVAKWVNDEEITYYMFTGQIPKNSNQIFDEFKKLLESRDNIVFLVLDNKNKKPIGYTGLFDINHVARKAEFRILIGDKDFWGKGLGMEITELMTFYGFDRLNLNKIYCGYVNENKAAGKAYKKAGYIKEGELHDDVYRNSKYYIGINLAIFRNDYYKNRYAKHKEKFSCKKSN